MTDPFAFLAGGGEAEQKIRARDWSNHPLGMPDTWPAELRGALSLVVNSPESMILAWSKDLWFFHNDTYAPLLGPRTAWAMGERFDKVWADGLEQAKPIIDDAFAGRAKRFVDLPWKLETDRGARDTWWSFSYSRVLDAQGEVVGLFILTSETTDAVRKSVALTDSEARYRTLFNTIDEGFCIIEFNDGPHGPLSDYVHVEANPAYARHAGIADVVGQKVREMVPDEAQGWVDLYGGVLRTGEPICFERELVATGRHLELSAFRIEPAERKQVAVLFKDVTARRQAEARLAQESERQRRSLQQIPGFVAILSGPAHIYEYVNDAYLAIAGMRDFIGRSVRDVFPDIAGQGFYELLDQVYATGQPFSARAMPIVLNGDAGERFIDLLYQPIRNDAGAVNGIFVGGYDVTDRIHAERGLAQANATLEQRVEERTRDLVAAEDALRQAQKMEAVGQLTGGLAHDFNNLLAGISGALEMMSTRLSQGRLGDVDKYVTAAQGAARRAAALTHRLLAFSRRQTLSPVPTNVNALVNGMIDLVQRTVGPAINVEAVGASGVWLTLVDPPQLENALLNLCINARDAMPSGGRITIETANKWLDRSAARRHDVPEGQYLSLCVTDTGSGMTTDVIERAFDPFFTTKPIGEGTGLGLSMIYGFAKQSGGQVRIYSEIGEGTTVCIYLPRYYGEADAEVPGTDFAALPAEQAGQTILVVDDEPTVRMLVSDVLEEAGYRVIEAADSAAGLRILQSDARIDLLISDVGLPGGMNGRQMADASRIVRPDLKVLFITGYAENAAIGNGRLGPGMQVLTKPFAVDILAARVRELVKV